MSIRNDIIINILLAIEDIKYDDAYSVNVADIKPFDEDYLNKFKGQTPLLMVNEEGTEEQVVADGTHDRFAITITVTGYLNGGSHESLQRDSNDMVAALKQFANSDPDLGANGLAMFWMEMPTYRITDSKQSVIRGTFQVLYWTPKGSY